MLPLISVIWQPNLVADHSRVNIDDGAPQPYILPTMNQPDLISGEPRIIPVARVTLASALALVYNRDLAIRLAWLPLVLSIVHTVGRAWISVHVDPDMTDPTAIDGQTGMVTMVVLATNIAYWLAIIAMVTAWHRLVIIGHDDPNARLRLSLQKDEWAYLMRFFVIFFAVLVVALLAQPIATAGGGMFGAVFAGILSVVILCRLSLILPAAAVGRSMWFKESWDLTTGNTSRLVFLNLMAGVPVFVVTYGLYLSTGIFDAEPGNWSLTSQIIVAAIAGVINILGLFVVTSIWSWSYRYLAEGADITLPGDRSE